MLLPSWYGAGSGLEAALAVETQRDRGLARLRTMYRRWPFFRSVIDNLRQVLAKVELHIAAHYAELARDVRGSATPMERNTLKTRPEQSIPRSEVPPKR